MRPFSYERADSPDAAARAAVAMNPALGLAPTSAPGQFIAGGTTMIDLMKLDVMRPSVLVDVNPLSAHEHGRIEAHEGGLRLGALVRMGDAQEHDVVKRDYPVIAQSLQLAASQQLRNVATLGGNMLQRTRCSYFRDTSWTACNKREPGSGCAAMGGMNRLHAVLGTSGDCIASYPGDFAQSLIALEASVETIGPDGARTIPFAELHRRPGGTPEIETVLKPGELITFITVPARPWAKRSLYLKIRDRESYAFAVASAAVALDLDGDVVRGCRIALGGVATVPWRSHEAEAALNGRTLDEASATAAAHAAFADADTREHNTYKVPLGRQTLVRALLQAAALPG